MISYRRQDAFGYRLQGLKPYQLKLKISNNLYRNHSQVSKEEIYRPFKGPLYNKAGSVCIQLTESYPLLEHFEFATRIEDFKQF